MNSKPTENLAVVIPMYNEEDNAEPLLREIQQALSAHPDYEIIAVDDGSTDDTPKKLKQIQEIIPQLKILRHRGNFGQSVGVVTGVKAASKDWIVTLDGDGQNDPADIMKLAQAAVEHLPSNKPILMAGHRVKREDSGWKKFGSRFANNIRRKMLKDNCPDTGCGLKLFPRLAFLALPHFNHLHRYLPALFLRAGGKVFNVPVGHRPRTRGQSKYGNWGRLKVGITDLIGVAWLIRRPCTAELEEDV